MLVRRQISLDLQKFQNSFSVENTKYKRPISKFNNRSSKDEEPEMGTR